MVRVVAVKLLSLDVALMTKLQKEVRITVVVVPTWNLDVARLEHLLVCRIIKSFFKMISTKRIFFNRTSIHLQKEKIMKVVLVIHLTLAVVKMARQLLMDQTKRVAQVVKALSLAAALINLPLQTVLMEKVIYVPCLIIIETSQLTNLPIIG